MDLAIFDLDNTLLSGDSDYLWGKFLCTRGLVDEATYEDTNQKFYDDYKAGTLDIYAFLKFSLEPLATNPLPKLHELRNEFLQEQILPIIPQASRELVKYHRDQGRYTLIITATNLFITQPIASELGVHDILATEPEFVDGKYTGNVKGIPCYKDGKVQRLNTWLDSCGLSLENSWFYSDSHNDLPLLELVSFPVAVDPDNVLESHAKNKNWKIISLSNPARGKQQQ